MKHHTAIWILTAFAWCAAIFTNAQAPQPDGAGIEPGTLPAKWTPGGPK